MAASLLARDVSDLCLGKPPLRCLSISVTISEALVALKCSEDNFISVWRCDHKAEKTHLNHDDDDGESSSCQCIGKISMVDVICYLCKDDKNLSSPSAALRAPVSLLLPKKTPLVAHVEPSCSLMVAIELMLQGAQNLVVPIRSKPITKRKQLSKPKSSASSLNTTHKNGRQFCWITQEDIIRYLLSSISLFSPVSAFSIDDLGIVSESSNVLAVDYYSTASVASVSQALREQTAVAVVDSEEDGMVLIGEISPYTLARCDETVAAALATLSAGDLMAYIDYGGPPDDLIRVVKAGLEKKGLVAMVQRLDESLCCSLSSSSDEESTRMRSVGKYGRSTSYSARMVRRAEAIVCSRQSSLVAVMIQAITHRVNYVWVVEEDCSLVGIVTFVDMLKVLRDHLQTIV